VTRVNGHGPGAHFAPPVGVDPFSALTHSVLTLVDQYNTMAGSVDVRAVRRAALEMDQHMNCVRSDLSAVLVALAAYPDPAQREGRGGAQPQTSDGDGDGKAVPDE
jgi:hypothetical protein